MRRTGKVLLLAALLLTGSAVFRQPLTAEAQSITASEAKNHIGETVTVCGKVVSAHYAASSRSRADFSQP